MAQVLARHFRLVLYAALAVFLSLNSWALVAGNYTALISLTIEAVVLVSVYLAKPWAYIAVRVWACILIVAGAAMWLAVLFGGVAYFHSLGHAAFEVALLVLGLYFFSYSKSGLQVASRAI
jgi:hypothetical protein